MKSFGSACCIQSLPASRYCKMISLLLISVLLCAASAQDTDLELAFEDNFDTLDFSRWQHQITLGGGGNFEFQYYTNNRTSSFVENGSLHIQPVLLSDELGEAALSSATLNIWGSSPADQCTGNWFYGCMRTGGAGGNVLNPIKSAALRSVESFYFTYGRVEVRARLPRGDWLWPAIWMLPRFNPYGQWPASGEVDIMESRGNAPGYEFGGRDRYGSTLHWGTDFFTNSFHLTHQVHDAEEDLSDDYHVYGLIWNETYIGTYLDTEDQVVLSVPINQSFWERGNFSAVRGHNPWKGRGDNAPFDREMYLIINLAVGGVTGFWPDGAEKPWNNSSPNSVNTFWDDRDNWYPTWTQPLSVDYVRVWTRPSLGNNASVNYYMSTWSLCVVALLAYMSTK